MQEHRLLCKKCCLVFDVSLAGSPADVKIYCPSCNSTDIEDTPPWAPIGSGPNIFSGDEWAYECQDCQYQFRMPIPKNPGEAKNRKCPKCKSNHLNLITGSKALPLYCG
jgi:Zn finger protein HypA/HybF involved in hydrogenase expression